MTVLSAPILIEASLWWKRLQLIVNKNIPLLFCNWGLCAQAYFGDRMFVWTVEGVPT